MKASASSSPVAESMLMSEKVSPISSPTHMTEKETASSNPVADTVHTTEKVSATSSPVSVSEASEKIVTENPSSE